MPQGKGTYGSKVGRPSKKARGGKKAGSVGAKRAGPKDTYERQFGVKPQSLQDYKDRKTMQEIKARRQKYQTGGEVGMNSDPLSTKNAFGVPAGEAMKKMNEENVMEGLKEAGKTSQSVQGSPLNPPQAVPPGAPPTANAQQRSQTYQMGGNVLKYKEGGKVNVLDIVKKVDRYEKADKKSEKLLSDPSLSAGQKEGVASRKKARKELLKQKVGKIKKRILK